MNLKFARDIVRQALPEDEVGYKTIRDMLAVSVEAKEGMIAVSKTCRAHVYSIFMFRFNVLCFKSMFLCFFAPGGNLDTVN